MGKLPVEECTTVQYTNSIDIREGQIQLPFCLSADIHTEHLEQGPTEAFSHPITLRMVCCGVRFLTTKGFKDLPKDATVLSKFHPWSL